MGSLNGDLTVMRNGRSTSQVSIYNYPEHLNPFYEDDQHKRLRFWKVSSKGNEGRRNSFSFGNLKDMWAFKSFRLKKKSSTLGITKTSESPPPLRRECVVDNGWNTFDNRLRGSATASINGDNFERNNIYRSSLQNLPSSNGRIGFNRNDDYRNTIQVARQNPRYRPQTKAPQPAQRSSQISVASTNPFDSDDEDDDAAAGGGFGGSTSTLSKATPRKKRRAPAPPTPIHGKTPSIKVDSSQGNEELCIREDTDIAHLTAEIESFVKDKSNEDIENVEKRASPVAPSPDVSTAPVMTETTTTSSVVTIVSNKQAPEESLPNANTAVETKATTADTVSPPPRKEEKRTKSNSVEKAVTASETPVSVNERLSELPPHDNVTTNPPSTSPVTEIVTVKTTITSTTTKAPDSSVQNHTERKVSDELKSNGAIPKKSSELAVENRMPGKDHNDLRIEEPKSEEHKPVPVRRNSKADHPAGGVECIHVHVESPKPAVRHIHMENVSSFKTAQSQETHDRITTKTPFTLTSPPPQRKAQPESSQWKENGYVLGGAVATQSTDVALQEQPQSRSPDTKTKPPLSPKPVLAEIHKPARGNKSPPAANGHVRRASREEPAPQPPVVPTTEGPHSPPQGLQIVEDAADSSVTVIRESHRATSPPPPVRTSSLQPHLRRDVNENVRVGHIFRQTPQTQLEWKQSTLAPLETHIPPEKRKSVKDIIESINRSQRLLHASANKDFTLVTGAPPAPDNAPSYDESLRILDERQREIRRIVQQIDNMDDAGPSNGATSASPEPPSYSECMESVKPDNTEVFKKCKVNKEVYDYRESSPITSNLDWNPLPKPKRTKSPTE